MALRPAVLITALALSALTLGGCTPTPAPAPSGSPVDTGSTPSATPTEEPITLPDDAVLGVLMHAKSQATGAELDIQLVVLKSEPVGSPAAGPRADASLMWCPDELDQNVIEAENGFSFGELDVTITPVAGTPAWPSDLPLHVIPSTDGSGTGPTIATGGDAYSVERPDDLNDPGYYVPHCLQDAFVTAPGTGSVYLGWQNDGTTLDAWLGSNYGATFDQWGEPIGDPPVELTGCTIVITDLGKSLGATDASFTEFTSFGQCIAVVASP